MEHDYILYEKKEQIAYITINRPESLNAVHPPANKEMLEVFSDFRDDHNLRVAILTGSGNRAFCAGDDLKYQVKHGKPGEPYPEYNEYPLGGITHDFKCWKPIIGAVNGYALGGGMELALGCDILIAVEHAKFGLPEPRVGVVAGAGGPYRLTKQIPFRIAMGMLLTGDPIDAKEAYRIGLINEVVPSTQLMKAAERWASRIIEGAPLSITASKQMALIGQDLPFDEAMDNWPSEFRKAMDCPDYIEGPLAFTQKRKPNWA